MLSSKLEYLFQFYTAKQLAQLLNVKQKDPGRYFRKIRSGQIKHTKYKDDIDFSYEDVRKSETPPPRKKSFQKKILKPKKYRDTLAFVPAASVIDTLSFIFDPQSFSIPNKRYKWMHRNSRLLVEKEAYPANKFYNTWVGYFIWIYFLSQKDARLKKYQRRSANRMNKNLHFTLGDIIENYEKADTHYLDYMQPEIKDRLQELAEHYPLDSPVIVSFLASKLSTAAISPDKAINYLYSFIGEDLRDTGNEKLDGDGRLEFIDIYSLTGWMVK